MTRAELVEQVRRLADQTAYLAAEVRRGDTALELLGQVRGFGHRLPPGLAADIRRVVDDMVASRMAHGEPSPSPTGTSSAGDGGQRSPVAPSTETRQAAQDGQSGSGGDAMEGVPAHQPTPQVGDVWETDGCLVRLCIPAKGVNVWHCLVEGLDERVIWTIDPKRCRLIERDGRPYPPAQEPDPAAGVEPATDAQIANIEELTDLAWPAGRAPVPPGVDDTRALIARVRQEQDRNDQYRVDVDQSRRERDEAVARAEAAEAALARLERVTALERAVVQAANVAHDEIGHYRHGSEVASALTRAVRALRDAQEAGQ